MRPLVWCALLLACAGRNEGPHPKTENADALISSLQFTRSTTAYEADGTGTLINYAVDQLRTDSAGRWHLEGGLQEVILRNEEIDHPVFAKTLAAVNAGAGLTPLGTAAQAVESTGAGDVRLSQNFSIGAGKANFSVYVRAESLPAPDAYVECDGVSTTVAVTTSWQRIEAINNSIAGGAHPAKFGFTASGPGQRLLFWGPSMQIASTARIRHAGSHVKTLSTPVTRQQDFLIVSAGCVPQRMLGSGAFEFEWVPAYGQDDHDDATFFSNGAAGLGSDGGLYNEILWVRDQGIADRDGKIWIRTAAGDTMPHVQSQKIFFHAGQVITIQVNPVNGHINVSGADSGNGRGGLETPYTWRPGYSMWIGERNGLANTHNNDGWISNPRAIASF